jgi:protoheme ferro-lyase
LVLAHFTSERVLSVVGFQKCSYYSPLEIKSCVKELNKHHQRIQNGPKLAVVEKYSKSKYENVASFSPISGSLQEKWDFLEKSFEGMD